MTRKQTDLRVRRTHKLLQDALIELIEERGFDAITVGDIAERAMVNRTTFYRYYQDKYDLVEKIFEAAAERMRDDMGPPRVSTGSVDPERPPEPWVKVFEHFTQHARLYRTMLGRNGSSWFVTRMREYIVSLMLEREQLREQLPAVKREPDQIRMPREIISALTANLFIGTIEWWLEDGKQYSPRQMATWLRLFLIHGYSYALGDVSAQPQE